MATPKNITVKLTDIVLPKNWNRDELGDIKALVQSIKTVGQKSAITVRPSETPGKVEIVDGRRRLAALHEAKITEAIVCFSDDVSEGDAFLTSLVTNMLRKDNKPMELARSFNTLVEEYGKKAKDIAAHFDKTEGFVSQHISYLKLEPEYQKALQKGIIGPSQARNVLRLLAKEEDHKFLNKHKPQLLAGEISATEFEEAVGEYFDKKKEKEAKKAKATGKEVVKEKKKGRTVKGRDFNDPAFAKQLNSAIKDIAIEKLTAYEDRRVRTNSRLKRAYFDGCIEGVLSVSSTSKKPN
jgi:ParB family chromosome partitioning protein